MGDEELAALVRPELEPYAGTVVVVGYGVACYGAADRYLGMLAATLGDWAVAEARFEAALDLNRRMGAPTWLAHTAYEYGRMLHAPRSPGRRGSRELDARRGSCARRAHRDADAPSSDRRAPLARWRRPPCCPTTSPRARSTSSGLVARGLSNRQIGEELFISEHTAANHMRSILRKTSCANRTEAATYAHRHGLAEGPTGR